MRNLTSEQGSIPLTLIIVILVGGLIAALVSVFTVTQRSVNFDRDFSEAITVADAGVQQALTYLQFEGEDYAVGTTVTRAAAVAALPPSDPDYRALPNAAGSGSFDWTATKTGAAQWNVRAEGTVDGVTRVIESGIAADPAFFLAAFGEIGVTFRGGNGADSYPSGDLGIVGSNGTITLNGASTVVDIVVTYGSGSSLDCQGCPTPEVRGEDEPLDMDEIRADVTDRHEVCNGGYTSFDLTTAGTDVNNDGVYELVDGRTYCTTDAVFTESFIIVDDGDGVTGKDDPLVFLVAADGDVDFSNGLEVNCVGCDAAGGDTSIVSPVSGALQFYSLGDRFTVGNQSHVAAATLAPNAACEGSPSNAQTYYYGSIICKSVSNQGGWQFNFDEDLLDVGSGFLDIQSYREEFCGTTSAGAATGC